MNIELGRIITLKVLFGALVVTAVLLVLTFALIVWTAPAPPDAAGLMAGVTSIPMPTTTPVPEATPTFDPYASTPTPTLSPGEFPIGTLIQISGTQGEGLRIRSDPGLNGKQLFLGFDTEAYTILDGPQEMDGYTWYYIAAINDQGRTGWAASSFLTQIINP